MRLMPPWPSDVGNCVVCHAWSADVGLESLYSVEPIRLEDVPSQATDKPIISRMHMDASIRGRERLPTNVAELIERECGPCHFAGGEVVDVLDLSDAANIAAHAREIAARVAAGEMPPDGGLTELQRVVIDDWLHAAQSHAE
jgi:uncharacterized membrane protein